MISAPILSVSCLECGVFKVGRLARVGQSLGRKVEKAAHLLGGLLLLLLLLLGVGVLLRLGLGGLLNRGGLLHLGLLLDGNELAEDVVNLGLGHLVSPGLEGVLEHLGVDLALV